jgi:hypothetical protein
MAPYFDAKKYCNNEMEGRTEANLRFGPNTKKAPLCIAQYPWELNIDIVSNIIMLIAINFRF